MQRVVQMLRSLKRIHTGDQPIIDEAIGRLAIDERWAVDFPGGFRIEHEAGGVLATRDGRQLYQGRSVATALRALVNAGAPTAKRE